MKDNINQRTENIRKTKLTQNLEKKAPFKSIKNLANVNLEDRIVFKLLPCAEH
jgi:hypothetical protein